MVDYSYIILQINTLMFEEVKHLALNPSRAVLEWPAGPLCHSSTLLQEDRIPGRLSSQPKYCAQKPAPEE